MCLIAKHYVGFMVPDSHEGHSARNPFMLCAGLSPRSGLEPENTRRDMIYIVTNEYLYLYNYIIYI